jgi:hypothetical protein
MDWRIIVFYPEPEALFPFDKKNPELFLRIISLAHAPMNVTDVSIGSINCDPNNCQLSNTVGTTKMLDVLTLDQLFKLIQGPSINNCIR